jgi:hypothetical protein
MKSFIFRMSDVHKSDAAQLSCNVGVIGIHQTNKIRAASKEITRKSRCKVADYGGYTVILLGLLCN